MCSKRREPDHLCSCTMLLENQEFALVINIKHKRLEYFSRCCTMEMYIIRTVRTLNPDHILSEENKRDEISFCKSRMFLGCV